MGLRKGEPSDTGSDVQQDLCNHLNGEKGRLVANVDSHASRNTDSIRNHRDRQIAQH